MINLNALSIKRKQKCIESFPDRRAVRGNYPYTLYSIPYLIMTLRITLFNQSLGLCIHLKSKTINM